MKKHVYGRKFSRDRGSRTALFRSLVIAFIKNNQIKTTSAKAHAVKPLIDKLVSQAKKGTLSSRRQILSELANNKAAVSKLEEEVKSRFADLSSGFTKVLRLGKRLGDNALMVKLMWSRESLVVKTIDDKKEKAKKESNLKKNTETVKR